MHPDISILPDGSGAKIYCPRPSRPIRLLRLRQRLTKRRAYALRCCPLDRAEWEQRVRVQSHVMIAFLSMLFI
jgi:hypothetical protein